MNLKQLFPLYIGAIISPLGGFGVVTLIPVFAKGWSIAFSEASLAITFYMIPFIIIQPFSGSIAQLFDVKKTLLIGFALYSSGSLFCALSPSLTSILVGRIIQGTGAGFLNPIIMASIGELVSEKHVGKAIGLLGMAYTTGVTLGPFISGIVEVRYGWSSFFYLLAATSIIAGILYAFTSKTKERLNRGKIGFLAILPILKKALLQPGILYLSFAAFSFFIAYIGIMTFTADYLQSDLELPSDRVGTLLSITGFSGVIVSPVAGLLGDRFGRKKVFLLGGSIAFFAIVLMAFASYTFPRYLLLFLLLGTGSATAWTTLNTMAVECSSVLRQPVTSVYNMIKFSGYALSPVILSFLYGPFQLSAVQFGCMLAILIAASLALKVKTDRHSP